MEKRIRIIWALSLVSALLLIGVQGYWLYNQYRYVVNAYAQEVADEILSAGEKEYKLRKQNIETSYSYYINKSVDFVSDSLTENPFQKMLSLSISDIEKPETIVDSLISGAKKNMKKGDTMRKGLHLIKDSLSPEERSSLNDLKNTGKWQANTHASDSNKAVDGPAVLNLQINADCSDENMHVGIDRAITNFKNPFREKILDSILSADMPGFDYSLTPADIQDSIGFSSWQLCGSLFSSHIDVLYMYSPFEKKGVIIRTFVPSPPLFARMAVQLLLSLGLILLLIGCLVLQIQTILKQQKINELREGFVNTMIHELKRPVQTLKAFISFLGNKAMRSDESATEQVVQDSMFELDNLSAYLQKLKDMIRADNDATSLQISRFNLQELIGKILRLVNYPASKKVEISVRYEMESVWIEADVVHVANVINNLIENAIKYSGEQVDIEIVAEQKGKELRLTVSDNGIGIPYSEQEKVFAKFYRGTNLPDKSIPGIGLGLSYVKLIAEAHRGNVSVLSDIGKGTSVILCLPQ